MSKRTGDSWQLLNRKAVNDKTLYHIGGFQQRKIYVWLTHTQFLTTLRRKCTIDGC